MAENEKEFFDYGLVGEPKDNQEQVGVEEINNNNNDYSFQEQEQEQEQSPYYSMEELDGLGDDAEIDMDRIPPSIKKLIDRVGSNNDNVEDKLRVPNFKVNAELNLDDIAYVRSKATMDVKQYLEQRGIEFNENDYEHMQLVQEHQNNLMNKAKDNLKTRQLITMMENDLKGKYGRNFDTIDKMVIKYMEDELPNSKSRELKERIAGGDTKLLYEIYNQCAKRYFNKSNTKTQKQVKFPPHAITGGNKTKSSPQKLDESYFL